MGDTANIIRLPGLIDAHVHLRLWSRGDNMQIGSVTIKIPVMNAAGKSVLANELAGVSGRAMLPINLWQVCKFRNLLPYEIVVIGVGGIETKDDADMYYKVGADLG